jgi:HAD superfamily hydrolase (TIGR01458 family)
VAVGAVGTRLFGTASAERSFSTSRSTASSRFRAWLRSSCATARRTVPARAITRRFWAAVSALDDSTSSRASTRVDDFCACCPPGPLDRDTRTSISVTGSVTERVTRIDSRSMASILLDIDGVLHVSGEPIPGASEAVSELRGAGHALRFVTNNSTRPRSLLADELRGMGFALEDRELQTTPGAAVRELEGKRVLALVMPSIVPDLDALDLVGEEADAVLIGGCDESLEPNNVFSYMNLARAFEEIGAGASFYCMHKNKWWQTSRGPMLDSGAFVAGLEYATGVEATVLGKPSPSYFAAALDALDAEPERTWLVTDDVEADIRGARLFGMRTALVRTGKFRPETLETADPPPDIVVSSLAHFPALLEEDLTGGWTP